MSYIPKVGDSVSAKRKVKTNGIDCVIGAVIDVSGWENTAVVKVVANGRDFYLADDDWMFQFLHVSHEHSENLLRKIALRLSGLHREYATLTEKQIADLLVESGYLSIDEDDSYIVK